MKKLILSAAVILGSLSIYAATTATGKTVKIETVSQSVFTEIAIGDIPAAILTALEDTYPGATVESAYVNEDGEYQLNILIDGQQASVYSDADGNWLKI